MTSSSLFLYIEINTNHTMCRTKRPPLEINDRNTMPISFAMNFFLKGQKNNLKKIVYKLIKTKNTFQKICLLTFLGCLPDYRSKFPYLLEKRSCSTKYYS